MSCGCRARRRPRSAQIWAEEDEAGTSLHRGRRRQQMEQPGGQLGTAAVEQPNQAEGHGAELRHDRSKDRRPGGGSSELELGAAEGSGGSGAARAARAAAGGRVEPSQRRGRRGRRGQRIRWRTGRDRGGRGRRQAGRGRGRRSTGGALDKETRGSRQIWWEAAAPGRQHGQIRWEATGGLAAKGGRQIWGLEGGAEPGDTGSGAAGWRRAAARAGHGE